MSNLDVNGVDQKAIQDHLYPGTRWFLLPLWGSEIRPWQNGREATGLQRCARHHPAGDKRIPCFLCYAELTDIRLLHLGVIFIWPLEHPAQWLISLNSFFPPWLYLQYLPTAKYLETSETETRKCSHTYVHTHTDLHMDVHVCVCVCVYIFIHTVNIFIQLEFSSISSYYVKIYF